MQNNVRSLIAHVRGPLEQRLVALENRAYVALATDNTITAAAYATLLTANITTVLTGGYLVITFSASGRKTTGIGSAYFQILVDGIVAKACYSGWGINFPFNSGMVVRVAVKKGAHTVLVQWKTDVNSLQINAASVVEEHAHLLVQEAA